MSINNSTNNITWYVPALQPSRCLSIYSEGGGDGGPQTFDAIGGGYYPDYTTYPLILEPEITVVDTEGAIGSGTVNINKDLANAKWTVTEDGVSKTVTNDSDYEVVTSGPNLGRLKIKRNIRPTHPVTFTFDADYLDPRTPDEANVYKIHMSHTLECDIQMQQYVLTLDSPNNHFYDPLGAKVKTITATVFSGKSVVPAGKRACRWQTYVRNVWVDIGSDLPTSFADVSADTMSLTVNMEIMGGTAVIRCLGYVGEDAADVQAKMGMDRHFAIQRVRLERRPPQIDANVIVPKQISRSQRELHPIAVVDTTHLEDSDVEKEFKTGWLTGANNAQSRVSYTQVASGLAPTIKVDKMTETYGQMLKFVMEDRGEWCYLTDKDNYVITDGSGIPIMIRKN